MTSSPDYPQSNGRAESAVKTAKQLTKKSKEAGTDFYLALLDWINTPTEGVGSSPVQRLCGRRTRTFLPTTPSLLQPAVPTGVRDKLLKNKEIQTQYYNRGTRELPPLNKGDVARMLPNVQAEIWLKAKVEDQVDVRSYAVRTDDGRMFRRNRRHLRKSQQPPAAVPSQPPTPVPSPSEEPIIPREPPFLPSEAVPVELPTEPPLVEDKVPEVPCPPDLPTGVRASRSGRQIKTPAHFKDFVLSFYRYHYHHHVT